MKKFKNKLMSITTNDICRKVEKLVQDFSFKGKGYSYAIYIPTCFYDVVKNVNNKSSFINELIRVFCDKIENFGYRYNKFNELVIDAFIYYLMNEKIENEINYKIERYKAILGNINALFFYRFIHNFIQDDFFNCFLNQDNKEVKIENEKVIVKDNVLIVNGKKHEILREA